MEEQNGKKIGESTMDINLAKPQDNRNKDKRRMQQDRYRGGPPGGYVCVRSQ